MKSINCLLYLGFLLFLVSCTITKRHFGNGYHVEWKKHLSKTDEPVVANEPERKDTLFALASSISEAVPEKITFENENEVLEEIPLVSGTEKQTPNEYRDELISNNEPVQQEVKTISQNKDYPDDPEMKKRVEPLTWVAFSAFLLAMTMFLIPLSFAAANASLLGLIFSLLIIGAAIVALISWIHTQKDPEKYKGKVFTGIVLFCCSAGVGLAVLTVIHFLIDRL